jgi:hypothetical protein
MVKRRRQYRKEQRSKEEARAVVTGGCGDGDGQCGGERRKDEENLSRLLR